MHQLQFQYFFPLTEQITLDLDFAPCKAYEEEKMARYWAEQAIPVLAGTGMLLTSSNMGTLSWSQRIGDWEIQSQNERPNKLQQWFMKKFFGLKWMGK